MSDTEKPKKRGYRMDGGKALGHDLRVRVSHGLHLALKSYAQSRDETPAAAAREILRLHLMEQGEPDKSKSKTDNGN